MQSTHQKKVTGRSPQPHRRAPERRGGRALQNGGAEAGVNVAVGGGSGLHLLTEQLRSLPLYEVDLLRGTKSDRNLHLIAMVDTEEKQLQAISDLWAIVKAQPRYRKIKSPKITVETEPVEVLHWLLKKLGPLAGGKEWTVDTCQVNGKARYRFIAYAFYHAQRVRGRCVFIPMDFLPYLEKRDRLLHDIVVDTVALMNKYVKVPLWDEDGDFSEAINELFGDQKMRDSLTMRRQRFGVIYNKGIARRYLELFRKRSRTVTPNSLAELVSGYVPASQRKRVMVWWVCRAIDMAREKDHIGNYSVVPNYLGERKPLTPFRTYKFVWSVHKNDPVAELSYNNVYGDIERYGRYLPVAFSVALPGERLKPIRQAAFPERLDEWMGKGLYWLTGGPYERYYYKNSYNENLTPSEKWMESMENNEISKQHGKKQNQ